MVISEVKRPSLFPADDLKAAKKAAKMIPESQVLSDVCQWLTLEGYLWWRMPIGPVIRGGGKNGVRFSKNPLKGFPDIAGILDDKTGQLFACELKRFGAKPTPEQEAWHSRLMDYGVRCFMAHSLDEFITSIKGDK